MTDGGRPAWAGIDTHKDTNTLALLDGLGRVLGAWEFPTTEAGCAELERAIGDSSVPVGVEGACSYGAGIAAHLRGCGYEVLEVIRPRREQRRRGKSDAIDAVAAAENLAAGRAVPAKELGGAAGDIRWLVVAREQLSRHAVALGNCVDSMLVTAPAGIRAAWAGMPRAALMEGLAARGRGCACLRSMAALAQAWLSARDEVARMDAELESLVREAYPAMLGRPGIGAVTAARLIAAAGSNPGRMGSEAAFSMLCGTSPIPASSGRQGSRHRLNRGGDRQANRAIHDIVRARMSSDERTKAYIAAKRAEGKTVREAVRCLCRFVAREVYRLLTGPQEPLPDGAALAARRRAAGLRQADVSAALGLVGNKVSRLERGITVDGPALREYDRYLSALEAENAGKAH